MPTEKRGIAKLIVAVVLIAVMGAAFLFMTQEQKARSAANDAVNSLVEVIDETKQFGPEEVRAKLGVEPTNVREPNRHRLIEEFKWKGPFSEHTVYAYYDVAATEILEAVSMNKKLDDWEE